MNKKAHNSFKRYKVTFLLLGSIIVLSTIILLILPNNPLTRVFTKPETPTAVRPTGIPDDWQEEKGCKGITLFHPENMNFFSMSGVDCYVGTVNDSVSLKSLNQPFKQEKDQQIQSVEDVNIGGVNGRRLIISNLQNLPVSLVYELNQRGLYYTFKADLTKPDYSLSGNLDLYRDAPDWKKVVDNNESSPTASTDEYIQLIDRIAQTIQFSSSPSNSDPNKSLLK